MNWYELWYSSVATRAETMGSRKGTLEGQDPTPIFVFYTRLQIVTRSFNTPSNNDVWMFARSRCCQDTVVCQIWGPRTFCLLPGLLIFPGLLIIQLYNTGPIHIEMYLLVNKTEVQQKYLGASKINWIQQRQF